MDDLPVVESNQPEAIPEHVLVDENEDLEEEEFEEEEEPQEEDDDMEVDIEEDKNELELTYPYEEVDPLNPLPPASESDPEDVIEVEDTDESEDETVLASVHETAHGLVKKKGKEKDEYYGKLILDLGNEVRSSVEERVVAMENIVRKLGNTEERAECKKLKKELEEARGFMFEERPNEAIDVLVEDEKSPSSKPGRDMQMLEMMRSGPVRGQDAAPAILGQEDGEPNALDYDEAIDDCRVLSDRRSSKNGAQTIELEERVKVDAYIRGLTDNIKGKVTSSKPANLQRAITYGFISDGTEIAR
ncbi:hypothetical protein Tco_0185021 [Tanacetum coccineum]